MAYMRGRRVAVPRNTQTRTEVKPFIAPTRGWVTNQNLAQSDGLSARICENWIPTETGVRVRGGSKRYASVGNTAEPVKSLFTYNAPSGSRKLFAGVEGRIYDITTVADPDVTPSAAITGQTNANWNTAQLGTTGGDYLVIMNGVDAPLLYDGSSVAALSSTFSITFSDSTTTSDLIYPFIHQNRLFMIKSGSLDFYYMPVASIGGAAELFTLKSIMQRGGYLLFGASWSVDSGIGADDRCVLVSSEGEVAVYTGSDPSNIFTWALIGIYNIGKPLGRNSWMRVGGDVIIATEEGAVPLSQIIQKDPAQLELSAISRPIEPDWRREYGDRDTNEWPVIKWTSEGLAIVGLPHSGSRAFVVNMETGAWGLIVGWDVVSGAAIGDQAYFGTSAGKVFQMESGGFDDTSSYLSRLQFNADHLGPIGVEKTLHMARVTYRSLAPVNVQVSASVDYSETFPSSPSAASSDTTAALWDTAVWDESTWDDDGAGEIADNQPTFRSGWKVVTGVGAVGSPQVQVSTADTRKPDCELVLFELMYEQGSYVS